MPGNTRHIKRVEATIKYSEELSENVAPQPGKPEIVISPKEYVRFEQWHVKRVFYFLASSSALCLAAVALVPKTAVQATALAIWAASVGLARFLLAGTYEKSSEKKPTD
jgi:hypothetical protein